MLWVIFVAGLVTGAGITAFVASGREAKSKDELEKVIGEEVESNNKLKATVRLRDATISALQEQLEQSRRKANFPLSHDPQSFPDNLKNGRGGRAGKNSAVEDQVGQQ